MATDFEEFASDLDPGFGRRIDDLLASAIEDQARDQRMLLEGVQGAQDEARRLRELIESRDEGVADLLEARLAGIATEESFQRVAQSLEERLQQLHGMLERIDAWKPAMEVQRSLAERLGETASSLKESIEEARSTLGAGFEERLSAEASEIKEAVAAGGARSFDRLVKLQEDLEKMSAGLEAMPDLITERLDQWRDESRSAAAATSRQIERLRGAVEAQGPQLAQEVGSSIEPFAEELRTLAGRVRNGNMKSAEVSARLAAMHESLVAYLAQRDDRLEKVRDQTLAELIERLVKNLKHRDRTRIAEALRRANRARRDRRDAERYRRLTAENPPEPDLSPVEAELARARPEPKRSARQAGQKGRGKPAV